MAVLDLQKAFEAHEAVFRIIDSLKIPVSMKSYLKYTYFHSKTSLIFQNENGELFHPDKGVRQDDPLSPTTFLLIFDIVLDLLPKDVGFLFDDVILNHIAYADDLVLLANSAEELQHLINILQTWRRRGCKSI